MVPAHGKAAHAKLLELGIIEGKIAEHGKEVVDRWEIFPT